MKLRRVWIVPLLLLLSLSSSVPLAHAQPATPVSEMPCAELMGIGSSADACVLVVHAVPGAPPVDVLLDGEVVATGLQFGQVTGYLPISSGGHDFAITTAGNAADILAALTNVSLKPGNALEVAAVGSPEAIQLIASSVDLSPIPPVESGMPLQNSRIRVVHAVSDAPAVNISVIGGDIAERVIADLSYPEVSDYVIKTAGQYRILIEPSSLPVASLDMGEFLFEGNTVYSMYAAGSLSEGELLSIPVLVNLVTGESTGRTETDSSTPATGLIVTIEIGSCAAPTDQTAWELEGSGRSGQPAGSIVPWGGDGEASGSADAIRVFYGSGEANDASFDQLLNRGFYSLVVRDIASGDTVLCGDIGGVVEEGEYFWNADVLIFGLTDTDGMVVGTATLSEEPGLLRSRVRVAVLITGEIGD